MKIQISPYWKNGEENSNFASVASQVVELDGESGDHIQGTMKEHSVRNFQLYSIFKFKFERQLSGHVTRKKSRDRVIARHTPQKVLNG